MVNNYKVTFCPVGKRLLGEERRILMPKDLSQIVLQEKDYKHLYSSYLDFEDLKNKISAAFYPVTDGDATQHHLELNCKDLLAIILPLALLNSPDKEFYFQDIYKTKVTLTNADECLVK